MIKIMIVIYEYNVHVDICCGVACYLLVTALSVSDGPATLYISQHCRTLFWNLIIDHEYVLLDDQAYLMVHPLQTMKNQPAYVKQDVCVATFAAPSGHQLLLHFIDVAIDYRPTYKSR
jgi:hypothetical protein